MSQSPEDVIVVGIGSSAGGIAAVRDLLEKAHCNRFLAFIHVPHMLRDYTSMIPEILSKTTDMPSFRITDGMKVDPCHLYFLPENNWVEVENGHFKLLPRPAKGTNQSADVLFTSLAREYKDRAIGVVLSGATVGQDGTAGVEAIQKAGGITIAQDPSTAEFPGMPTAAIESGCIEHVLPPDDIGRFLSSVSFEVAAEDEHRRSLDG